MRAIEDLCDRTFDASVFGYFLGVLRKEAPESRRCRMRRATNVKALIARLESELGDRRLFLRRCARSPIFAAICHAPLARAMRLPMSDLPRMRPGWIGCAKFRRSPPISSAPQSLAEAHNIAAEFEGPDGRIHWRDSRLEWPVRHGFIDLVAREFHAGKMMFPPDAS